MAAIRMGGVMIGRSVLTFFDTLPLYAMPALFGLVFGLGIATGGSVPAAAQDNDEMALQRCIWACLANSEGAGDPAYHACVDRQCSGVSAKQSTRPRRVAQNAGAQQKTQRARVSEVQQLLTDLGYEPGPVDGAYGPQTAEAIRQFLVERGRKVDVVVNDWLVEDLKAALKEWSALPNPNAEPEAGSPATEQPGQAPAPAAASQPPASAMSPHDFVAGIYTLPDPDVEIWSPKRREQYFSRRILDLVEAAEGVYKRRYDMDGLDFNPVVPGQDYKLSNLSVSNAVRTAKRAIVTVRFTSTLGGKAETYTLAYELVPAGQSWRVDEIVTDGKALSDTLIGLIRS